MMEEPKTEVPKICFVFAWILLTPIILPCMLIMAFSVVAVALIIMIPTLIIALIKDGGGILVNYINYKRQVRKIIKDFVSKGKTK